MTIKPGIIVAEEDASGAITLQTYSKVTVAATPGSFTLVASFRTASELHAALKACLGLGELDDSELTKC